MTPEKTNDLLSSLNSGIYRNLDQAPLTLSKIMAEHDMLNRDGYLALTVLLKAEINRLATEQKEKWKTTARAAAITELILIRRASKIWAAASYRGDPLMMAERRHLLAATRKAHDASLRKENALSTQKAGLLAMERDLAAKASALMSQARIASAKHEKAKDSLARLASAHDSAIYDVKQTQTRHEYQVRAMKEIAPLQNALNAPDAALSLAG